MIILAIPNSFLGLVAMYQEMILNFLKMQFYFFVMISINNFRANYLIGNVFYAYLMGK